MSRSRAARRWTRMRACGRTAPSRPDRGRGDEGFTLVEVMAAMFVFAVVSTAAFTIIVSALDTVRQNNQRVLTANVARSQVEYLRTLGTTGITPGLTTTKPAGTPANFTVETTAQWVGLGQTASACDAATPGQAYMRVHVMVTSPDVEGASVLDTVIAPTTAASTTGTAAVAISVIDQNGDPVSGVTIQGIDSGHASNSFTYVTGGDGCLFIPQLYAPSTLQVTISKSGYVPSTATGNQATVPLTADSLAKPTFHYAPAGAIDFSGSNPDFPLPATMPVRWQLNETGSTSHVGAVGTKVTGQWPTVSGLTAWAGDCPDADPQAYATAAQQFSFVPGGTLAAELSVRPVRLRGLPADTPVTVKHVGGGVGCTNTAIPIGRTNERGVITVGLPNGNWEATSGGETQPIGVLSPPAPGDPDEVTKVSFTLANLDEPSPSASPSESPSPTPSGSP